MIKSKTLAIATIAYAALIQTALAKEIPGKVSWLEADTNADGVISFIEFQERDQFDTGLKDKDGDGLLSLDEFLQPNPKKTGQKSFPMIFLKNKKVWRPKSLKRWIPTLTVFWMPLNCKTPDLMRWIKTVMESLLGKN